MSAITVLTLDFEPSLLRRGSRAVRGGYGYLRGVRSHPRGPSAVLASIKRGGSSLGIPIAIDPKKDAGVSAQTLVVSGVETLRRAIALKEMARISRLIAGPNIVVRADEQGGLLAHPAIDLVIVPSEWVRVAYVNQRPTLADRIAIWAAGVDTRFFDPPAGDRKHVLVYHKNAPASLLNEVLHLLRSRGLAAHLIRYGSYTRSEYRDALAGSNVAIFLSRSESQGLALGEAWAMDVPTYVWDPQEFTAGGWTYDPVTSCPYLSEQTGKRWKTIDQLKDLFRWQTVRSYAPRDWVLSEMTDELCMEKLLNLIGP